MSRQRIRYLRTSDGIQLAWAEAGSGPPLVKAASWLTHLEYDWDSPVWQHWMQFLSGHFRYIRYDERGCGMTDWKTGDLSLERWVADLENVVDAAGISDRMALPASRRGRPSASPMRCAIRSASPLSCCTAATREAGPIGPTPRVARSTRPSFS